MPTGTTSNASIHSRKFPETRAGQRDEPGPELVHFRVFSPNLVCLLNLVLLNKTCPTSKFTRNRQLINPSAAKQAYPWICRSKSTSLSRVLVGHVSNLRDWMKAATLSFPVVYIVYGEPELFSKEYLKKLGWRSLLRQSIRSLSYGILKQVFSRCIHSFLSFWSSGASSALTKSAALV